MGEVFDAETFAIYQALRICDEDHRSGHRYTIFSDLQAAIQRIRPDGFGPGQHWARAAPAHLGVEGNEQADARAKRAAEGEDVADPEYLGQEASLSHLSRKTTEARSRTAGEWARSHVRRERRHRPPPGGRLRGGLGKVRKELV